MTDRCASCHGTSDLQAAALYDTGGVAHLQLCLLCRKLFEQRASIYQPTVCVLCRQHKNPSRSEGLRFLNSTDEDIDSVFHICNACRRELLCLEGGEVVPT